MSETQVTTETQIPETNDLDAFSTEFFGEKKVPEEAAKPDAEQETEKKVEEKVTEAQVDESEDESEEIVEEQPKKKTVQDRINELVKQREDAKRDADAEIAKLRKEFEEKLAAIAPKAPEKKTTEPSPTDQNEDGSDKYPLGEFDPHFIRDLTRFTLETERAQAKIRDEEERRQQEQEQAEKTLVTAWNEKVKASEELYPDFQEKGQALINTFNNLDRGYSQYLTNLLMSMDNGPDVLYYLSNNPDEAVKIVNSGAQRATLALGRIEAKFIEADQEKQRAKPRISKAPAPAPVQNRGMGGGSASIAPDTDDLEAFETAFFQSRKK